MTLPAKPIETTLCPHCKANLESLIRTLIETNSSTIFLDQPENEYICSKCGNPIRIFFKIEKPKGELKGEQGSLSITGGATSEI